LDDIKDIIKRALDTEDNYNLLFIGPASLQSSQSIAYALEGDIVTLSNEANNNDSARKEHIIIILFAGLFLMCPFF
jgi:hypothetical protein